MLSHTLKRLGGLSLLVGGFILIVGIVPTFFFSDETSTANAVCALIRLIGAMLLVLGLPGVYAGVSTRAGVLGLLGFVCTALFFLMALATEPIFAFVFPYLATKAPAVVTAGPPPTLFLFFIIDSLLELVGGVLLGIAVLRSGSGARWSGLALLVGAVLSFGGGLLINSVGDVGTIILTVGLAWLALGLWPSQQQPEAAATPIHAQA